MDILIAALISALLTGVSVWFYASAKQSERLLKANDLAAQERSALMGDLARAQEQAKNLAEQINAKSGEMSAVQEQMKLWFENNANTVLQKTSEQLQVKSQQGLDAILNPVKERLTTFEKKVEEVYGQESRERIGLKAQIELAMQMNQQTNAAANNLTSALKGDAKKRGNWGEMQLENILTNSGMFEERDYYIQGRGLKLKNEDGKRQLPDFIVRMPREQHVIVDSKVTLNSYTDYSDAQDEEARKALGVNFINAVRHHIDDLSSKKYQDHTALNAHPLVLMFVPIESALGAALDIDTGLLDYARSKRVILIGPSGLMVALRALHSLMQSERLEHNANEIAKEAADLYDKLRLVVESLNTVGKNIEQTRNAYDKAIGQLATGPGNVIKRVESFRKRGVTVTKPIAALDYAPQESEDVTE